MCWVASLSNYRRERVSIKRVTLEFLTGMFLKVSINVVDPFPHLLASNTIDMYLIMKQLKTPCQITN